MSSHYKSRGNGRGKALKLIKMMDDGVRWKQLGHAVILSAVLLCTKMFNVIEYFGI